jgi:hypothetical protein
MIKIRAKQKKPGSKFLLASRFLRKNNSNPWKNKPVYGLHLDPAPLPFKFA